MLIHRATRRTLPWFVVLLTSLPVRRASAQSGPEVGANAGAKPRLTKAPKVVEFIEAEYPESEKAAGRAAAVVVDIAISATGNVDDVRVVESAGPAFDEAAVAAVRRFRFEPAEIDNVPSPIRIRYRYEFVLKEEAPTEASFAGVVRVRGTFEPLAGVRVELDDGRFVDTDAAGRFEITGILPGSHRVLLSRSDLRAMQTQEAFEAGRKLEAVYEIEQKPEQQAVDAGEGEDLEIVVVAPKLTKQVVSTRVDAAEAKRVAGTQGDVLKIVENLPGVARATAGSGQLVVWGASPEDTRVAVDGVPIPLLYHFGGLRSVVHGDLVGSVELIPGGYAASFGRGLGGLVRVDTRDPAEDRLHGSVQIDIIDASAAVHGPLRKDLRVALAVRRSHLDSVLDGVSSEDLGEFFPIPEYYDAQARVRYQPAGKSWIELGGLTSSDQVTRSVASADPTERKRQTQSLDFQRAFLRYQRDPGDGSRTILVPWLGRDQRRLIARFGATPTLLNSDSGAYGLRASYEGRVSEALTGNVGLDLELYATSLRRAGSVSSPPREGDAQVFGQPPSDQVNVDSWSTVQGSAAPYVELDFTPFGEVLHVVPGVRLEPLFQSVDRRIPTEGSNPGIGASRTDLSIEPRVSLRYTPSRRATLKAAFGRYHQSPAANDLSSVFGNPLLGPAEATHWLGGARVEIASHLELETTAFYTVSSALAVRNPLASPLIAQALVANGTGRSFGAQFLMRRELSAGFFGWVAYTLLRSERQDRPSAAYRLFDYDQTHVLTALASYDLGAGFDVGVRFRYATGYPRTQVVATYYDARNGDFEPVLGPKNGSRIPAFVQADARVSKRFRISGSELELYADVQNVTDRENAEEVVYAADYSQKRFISGLPILPVIGARWSY